jgi:Holliday junction DNA helicase RuvA
MVSSLVTSISGTLQRTGEDWVEISMGGITLRISIPGTAIDSVGRIGQTVTLYTSLQVREDSLSMYGFPTEDERRTFETLLNISGIGPRLALAMLGRFSPLSLSQAVEAGDTRALSTVPGVGRRTASRIVLELKGKLELDFGRSGAAAAGVDADLADALTALGYRYTEAREAIARTGTEIPEEERIRTALEYLAGA